jgi:muramoyltetrapeptide carboxypeptidase
LDFFSISLRFFTLTKIPQKKMDRRYFSKSILATMGTMAGGSWLLGKGNSRASESCKPILPGSQIGLISPSSSTTEEKVKEAMASLEAMGFVVKLAKHLNIAEGFLAGSDAQRVEDLHNMLEDEEISAIWCLRGGYGSIRLLPLLDYSLIARVRKPLVGLSDVTALLNGIYCKTGLQVIHGPVGTSSFTPYTQKHVLDLLLHPQISHKIEPCASLGPDEMHPIVLREGHAEGPLLGGNLTVLASMCGTEYLPDFEGSLLFLEDVGEVPYRLDRCLTQLKLSIDFHKISGLILGHFTRCTPAAHLRSYSVIQTFVEAFRAFHFPIVYGYSFGHIENVCSFPLGRRARLNTRDLSVELLSL